jgi:acetyl-CoA carboxylase carboxyltransferase component
MCGKAYDPRFIFAWPSAKIAVMGGEQAAKTLLQIQVSGMKAKGKEVAPEEEQKLLQEIMQRYQAQTSPYYAASRLWVDGIIDPGQTRNILAECLSATNQAPVDAAMKLGVFQV